MKNLQLYMEGLLNKANKHTIMNPGEDELRDPEFVRGIIKNMEDDHVDGMERHKSNTAYIIGNQTGLHKCTWPIIRFYFDYDGMFTEFNWHANKRRRTVELIGSSSNNRQMVKGDYYAYKCSIEDAIRIINWVIDATPHADTVEDSEGAIDAFRKMGANL